MIYTPWYVEARLVSAIATYSALPDRDRKYLTYKSSMPAPIDPHAYPDTWDASEQVYRMAKPVRLAPTAKQISLADEAIEWLGLASESQRPVVNIGIVMKSRGVDLIPWSHMRKMLKWWDVSPDAIRKRYFRGLDKISDSLNGL